MCMTLVVPSDEPPTASPPKRVQVYRGCLARTHPCAAESKMTLQSERHLVRASRCVGERCRTFSVSHLFFASIVFCQCEFCEVYPCLSGFFLRPFDLCSSEPLLVTSLSSPLQSPALVSPVLVSVVPHVSTLGRLGFRSSLPRLSPPSSSQARHTAS